MGLSPTSGSVLKGVVGVCFRILSLPLSLPLLPLSLSQINKQQSLKKKVRSVQISQHQQKTTDEKSTNYITSFNTVNRVSTVCWTLQIQIEIRNIFFPPEAHGLVGNTNMQIDHDHPLWKVHNTL